MLNARFLVCLALTALVLPGCAIFGSKETDEKLETELANLMLDHQILETRMSLAEDRIISLQTQFNEVQENLFKSAKKEEPVTEKPAPVKAEAPKSVKPESPAKSVQDAYQKALDTFMARKYKEAEGLFKDFIKKHPKSALMPNAGYWLGESYYGQKRYDEAILSFQSVVRSYPKHQKAADSLLKTGYSYERLGDKANARFYLEQVRSIYPKTRAASLAGALLDSLG